MGQGGSASTALLVNATPSIQRFYASPTAIDLGQTITLYANVFAGTPPYHYNWSALPVGCTSVDTASIKCTPIVPGPFTVVATATDAFNASIAGNISFVVNQDMVINSVAVSPVTVDSGVKISLYSNVTYGTLPYTYSFGGVPTAALRPTRR